MVPYNCGNFIQQNSFQINLRQSSFPRYKNLSKPFFKGSYDVSDDSNDLFHEPSVTGDLSVPFMHKITENHSDESVEFKIDIRWTRQCRKDLVEGLMCGRTENLMLFSWMKVRDVPSEWGRETERLELETPVLSPFSIKITKLQGPLLKGGLVISYCFFSLY